MGSTSTKTVATKSILTPMITLNGHGCRIQSISYFPDGQRMISGSWDKTTRQWELKAGKEIEEARGVCERWIRAVTVSMNGRWVTTGGGDVGRGELRACEVETGIVKTFQGHSQTINCIDISADNTQLASGSWDETARIWDLDTSKLAAGPFKSEDGVGAVRFSPDSKKLAVRSYWGSCLEVWDIQSQKLDVRVGEFGRSLAVELPITYLPVFWTNDNKTIITAFSFTKDDITTIYEFDISTLKTVGTPFKGHTERVTGLALSFDQTFLASASADNTIKLWAFESRQLLTSFDVQNTYRLVLSPDSRQLAYTVDTKDDYKIYTCNIPPDILAQTSALKKSAHKDLLLNSDATRRPPAGYRGPPISAIPTVQRPPPTRDSQQPVFIRLRQLLPFTSRAHAAPPVQPRNPLDVPATSPLPSSLSGQTATRFNHFEMSSQPPPSNGATQFLRQHLSFLAPRHSLGPPIVEVAPGRKFTRLAAAKFPEYKKVDDTRHPSGQQGAVPQENDTADIDSLPDVHWCKAFLCYCSCWSHGRPRMPPRWRLERIDIPTQDGTTSGSRGGAQSRT